MRRAFLEKRKMRFIRAGALALAGALLASLSACEILPKEEEFRQAPTVAEYSAEAFVTTPCLRADVETVVTVSVSYVPIQTAKLSFGVAGKKYSEIYVKAGDMVKEGDLLAELDMEELLSKIEDIGKNIASYELQLRHSEESRALALQKAAVQYSDRSPEERDEAIRKVNETYDATKQSIEDKIYIAGLKLQDYEAQKSARQITAPFDGTVTYVYDFTSNDVSELTKTVITLADSSLSLFKGTTEKWEIFTPGTEVTVVKDNAEYEAVVRTEEELGIEATEHISGKRATVYLVLKEVTYDLKAKDSGKVTIVTQSRKNVLSVPIKSVSEINGEPVVYVADEKGLKSYRKVELGLVGDSRVEILSGLEEGERVVIN